MGEYKDEDLYTFGTYAAWGATITKAVYLLVNFNLWSVIRFLPDLALTVFEMSKEFDMGDLVPEDIYKMIFAVIYTRHTADYMGQAVGFVLGIVFGDASTGLPFLKDEYYFNKAFPTTFSMDHMYIMKTLSWWLKLAALVLKELGGPLLDKCFGEMDIAYALAWDFVNDVLAGLDFNFGGAIDSAIWMLPWYAIGWFVFDGEVDDF